MAVYYYYQTILGLTIITLLGNVNFIQSSPTKNACTDYCSTGGVCLENNNGPKCICLPEWKGERCDIPEKPTLLKSLRITHMIEADPKNDPCSYLPSDFCKNNGMCYVDQTNNKFACQCRDPYAGAYCEDFSKCYNYCLNNGDCQLNSGAPECTCEPGTTGDRCEQLATTTTSVPSTTAPTTSMACNLLDPTYCKNGGKCAFINNQIQCECPSTHTGIRCESIAGSGSSQGPSTITRPPTGSTAPTAQGRTCADRPCQNGSKCYNNGNSYFCWCDSQHTGKDCEISI